MTEKEKLVTAAARLRNGKKVLPCAAAFQLSSKYDIPVKKIGAICNKNGIKITSCQLGCFK